MNYTFNPFNRSFAQIGSNTDAAFTGHLRAICNPLDTPEYFVGNSMSMCSDANPMSGFNYWSDQILACSADVLYECAAA